MRRYLLCICCLMMLFACSEKETGVPTQKNEENILQEDIQPITSMSMIGDSGAGNETGYYYLKMNLDGVPFCNIKYIDYESRKEIFLCNKPSCKHDNENCTSYLPSLLGGTSQLYLDEKYLYILCPIEVPLETEQTEEFISGEMKVQYKMYRMDLDGGNRKITMELDKNVDIQSTCFSQANYLYIIADEAKEDQSIQKSLLRINGETGEIRKLRDMQDTIIAGAYQNQLVFVKSDYYAMHFSNEDSVSDMQNAFAQSEGEIILYSTDTKKETSVIKKSLSEIDSINITNDGLFYNKYESNTLYKIDLENKKEEIFYDNLRGANVGKLDDTHLKLEFWDDKEVNASLVSAELLDLTNKETIPLIFAIPSPHTYIDILASTKDQFLVISGYDAVDEYIAYYDATKTSINDEYLALIDKEDYYQQQLNFAAIDRKGK